MRVLLLIVSLLLVSCDQVEIDFFDLGDFRVMALVADLPEVDATTDTDVTITPWISDIDAGGRMLSLTIVACPDPGIALGEVPTCDISQPTTQEIAYADFDTNTLSGSNYTGAMTPFTVTVPAGLVESLSTQAQFNGVDYIVSINFEAGDDAVSAFKRIRVSTNPEVNNNPQIEAFLIDGSNANVLQDGSIVTFTVADGFGPETYELFNEDNQLIEETEEYLLTWFVYSGTLSLSRSEVDDEAEFQDDAENGDTPILVGVLRDNRGGSHVLIR